MHSARIISGELKFLLSVAFSDWNLIESQKLIIGQNFHSSIQTAFSVDNFPSTCAHY